jgi:hypothetical protein
MRNKPINTQKEAQVNPAKLLLESVLFPKDAVERQEAQGQQSFIGSDTLPTHFYEENGKKILESYGVVFQEPVEDDPLFQYVVLPSGWKKVPTDHSMWSDLVDDKGRVRAKLFYKAAHYDRRADISICTRFSVKFDYDKRIEEQIGVAYCKDGETILFSTKPIPAAKGKEWKVTEEAIKKAEQWMKKHFPDWKNPASYWD